MSDYFHPFFPILISSDLDSGLPGTAVYVQVILTGSERFPTGNSDYTFYIDNATSAVFQRAPNGDTSYQFNQTIFSKTGLSNSLHTLTIESGHGGQQSLVLLDSVIYT